MLTVMDSIKSHIMSSSQKNQTRSRRMSSSAQSQPRFTNDSSKETDPLQKWDPEEVFETTVNERGEAVPDPYSFVDGSKMSKGKSGHDEGDLFEAAQEEFDLV